MNLKNHLNDGNPRANNLEQLERPRDSGNPLIDQISEFAYIHGIDPKIFNKDNEEAHKAFSHLSLSL